VIYHSDKRSSTPDILFLAYSLHSTSVGHVCGKDKPKGDLGRVDLVDELLMAFFVFPLRHPHYRLLGDYAYVSRIFELEIAARFAHRVQVKIHCCILYTASKRRRPGVAETIFENINYTRSMSLDVLFDIILTYCGFSALGIRAVI
jgi:hypothetical protein